MAYNRLNEYFKREIKKFQNILQNEIIREFLVESIEAIKWRANEYASDRVKHQGSGYNEVINSWQIKEISPKYGGEVAYQLRNGSEIATYLEFGTGIVGEEEQQDTPDSNSKYRYDVNEHGEDGWTYYNKEFNMLVRGFTGYGGKYFFYDAIWDYFYEEEFVDVFKNVLKRYENN